METIKIQVIKSDVYEEVAKATDYTGSKLESGDDEARDRILAADDDLANLSRFWEETVTAVNENFKEMLMSGNTKDIAKDETTVGAIEETQVYEGVFEVSMSFDKSLTSSIESALRSFFITSIIGQWFKFANKGEAADYFNQAAEALVAAERLFYSRRKPRRPTC